MQRDDKEFFSDEETKRRMDEVMRRMAGCKPTFDLKTGQVYEGEKLTQAELLRRGYDKNVKAWWEPGQDKPEELDAPAAKFNGERWEY